MWWKGRIAELQSGAPPCVFERLFPETEELPQMWTLSRVVLDWIRRGGSKRFAFQSLLPNLSKCEQATASSCCQSQSGEADCVSMPFPPWWVTPSVYGNKLFIPYITSYPIYKDHVCGGGLFQITSNSIFLNDTSLVGILPKDKRLTEILRNLTLYSVVLF